MTQALRQHAADSDVTVTAAVLGTLSRVASACARLHLRKEVLATPDVALSIMLLEESFQQQVMQQTCALYSPAHRDSVFASLECENGPRAWKPTEVTNREGAFT